MANIIRQLLGRADARDPSRMDQNDWMAMMMAFNFNGNTYPIGGANIQRAPNQESIQNDFVGYINSLYKANGIVFAVTYARALVFSQMRFQWQKMNKGRPGDLFGNDDLAILETPMPRMTTGHLLRRASLDADLAGNYYAVRQGIRGKAGSDVIRRLRPDWTDLVLTAPPEVALKSDVLGLQYRPGNTDDADQWEWFPIDGTNGQVIHWAPIPDPDAQYRGMSWLTPALIEIMSDKAMNQHKNNFFRHAATPNIAVSFKESVTYNQFRKFMEKIDRDHSGVDHAYETLYLGGGADVKVLGGNMREIDFKVTQGHGETRICAAGRIHPVLVGVSEDIRGTPLSNQNLNAAKNLFIDMTMRPTWGDFCAAVAPILDDPGKPPRLGIGGKRLWYDDRDIPFLRADRKDEADLREVEATIINQLITAGFTPESIVKSLAERDWSILAHTGLYSVQLQPPGMGDANDSEPLGADEPSGDEGDGDSGSGSSPADTEGDGK